MKTKDLIKKLQEQDPSGELHVAIGGHVSGAIYGVQRLEGYYDGHSEYLETDEKGNTRFVLDNKNQKVRLYFWDGPSWAFEYMDEKSPDEMFKRVAYDGDRQERLEKWIERYIKEAKEEE